MASDLLSQPAQQHHIVQFYQDEQCLADVVAQYLAAGLEREEPIVALATPSHCAAFSSRLKAHGIDADQASAEGRLLLLDARATLTSIMIGDLPDAVRFEELIGAALDRVGAGSCHARPRAYGEMVDLLWQDGNRAGAVRLEELWNDFGRKRSFSLLCAYDLGRFRKDSDAEKLLELCNTHSHVIPTESYSQVAESDGRLREVTQLQQRALALESEIEHRKQVEQALREALRQRDDFLAIAGHELKTPLTAVQLLVHSLGKLTAESGDPQIQTRVARAARGINRLSTLVDELLDVSRVSAGKLKLEVEEFDLGAVAGELIDGAADQLARAGCKATFTCDGPMVGRWDRSRVEQILVNLLSNAMKYGKGHPIELRIERAGATARISVRDHGIGISPADQQRIFDRFERAVSLQHFGGLGLGLWIVRQVVEAHGGTIRVESEPADGATFLVDLPIV